MRWQMINWKRCKNAMTNWSENMKPKSESGDASSDFSMKYMRNRVFLSIAVIFTFGALVVNALWVHYYNKIDKRHVEQINELTYNHEKRVERMERSYKRQLGEMRNRVEKKVDRVLEKLDALPPTPIVIDARKEIEKVRHDDD